MHSLLQTWLQEPRADNPPKRVWRDYVLILASVVGIVLELALRDDVRTPWVAAPFSFLIALAVLWRRTHPRESVIFAFGGIIAYDTVMLLAGYGALNIYTPVTFLVLMYALFRWGSGRDTVVGVVLALALFAMANIADYTGGSDLVGGFIVMWLPVAIGLAVRYGLQSREQAREQIRISEREQLARELHDTVAHHVSAIAIQAQAGRFVAQSGSLDGAADALAVIEEEASRTLHEMRSIVGVLRDAERPAELAPQHGIHDIDALAAGPGKPAVQVTRSGDLATVNPAVGSAVYRIAQESITNARRHASNAKTVQVEIDGQHDQVVVTVTDDGDPPTSKSTAGFGLIGMTERATLLGGTLQAGPAPNGGWHVSATLPRDEHA